MVNSGTSSDCNDTRLCFAARYVHGGFRVCNILTSTYEQNGKCHFCKPDKDKPNEARRNG